MHISFILPFCRFSSPQALLSYYYQISIPPQLLFLSQQGLSYSYNTHFHICLYFLKTHFTFFIDVTTCITPPFSNSVTQLLAISENSVPMSLSYKASSNLCSLYPNSSWDPIFKQHLWLAFIIICLYVFSKRSL